MSIQAQLLTLLASTALSGFIISHILIWLSRRR